MRARATGEPVDNNQPKGGNSALRVLKALEVYVRRGRDAKSLLESGQDSAALEMLAQRDRGFANLQALIYSFDRDLSLTLVERNTAASTMHCTLADQVTVNANIQQLMQQRQDHKFQQAAKMARGSRVLGHYKS